MTIRAKTAVEPAHGKEKEVRDCAGPLPGIPKLVLQPKIIQL